MMYDGHYRRPVRREPGHSRHREEQQRRLKVSGQFRKCHFSSDLHRGPLMGERSLKTPRDYYPSSPLLFVLVQCAAAALLPVLRLSRVASQIMA